MEDLQDQARELVREASPWLEGFGRFGFAAKGLVYIVVGLLAGRVALGVGGQTTDARGALEALLLAPFGQLLLLAITAGLAGYALWRVLQAVFDTENQGRGLSGLWARASYVAAGLAYFGLALSAAELLDDLPEADGLSDSEAAIDGWTAWLLEMPFGEWLVGGVGLLIVYVGLFQIYRAVSASFEDKLRRWRMSDGELAWARRLGRLGFAARGVAIVVIGGFLGLAALHADPSEARGLGGAMATLASGPFGPWLLAVIAFGLVAYGLYLQLEARFRRMVLR